VGNEVLRGRQGAKIAGTKNNARKQGLHANTHTSLWGHPQAFFCNTTSSPFPFFSEMKSKITSSSKASLRSVTSLQERAKERKAAPSTGLKPHSPCKLHKNRRKKKKVAFCPPSTPASETQGAASFPSSPPHVAADPLGVIDSAPFQYDDRARPATRKDSDGGIGMFSKPSHEPYRYRIKIKNK
jgi:hypothetical protein